MKLRKETLWRIPLYYLTASFLCFYPLLWVHSLFTVKTVNADGIINVSTNPVCTTIGGLLVLLVVLLIGGFWLCRTMTRREIAVSSGILSAVYFLWGLSHLLVPNWDASIPTYNFICLNMEVASLLSYLIGQSVVCSLLGSFTPMLFVLFGRKELPAKSGD